MSFLRFLTGVSRSAGPSSRCRTPLGVEGLEDRTVPTGGVVFEGNGGGESVFSLDLFEQNIRDYFVDNSIGGAYSINQNTGELTLIGHTTENIDHPRGFAIDPTGRWLYAMNQQADTIVQLEIDPETGELTPTGNITEAPVPVSMVFKQ